MTVSSTTTRNNYTGSGTVGPFSYNFRIFSATDLTVTTADLAGNETTLTYPVDYSVSGVGNSSGGSITLTTALTTGYALAIQRILPLLQTTELRNQGSQHRATVEDMVDYATMVAQQIAEVDDRTVQLPTTVDPTVVSPKLPAPVANQVIAWNANATALTGTTISTGSIGVPGNGRTVATATAYLANNAIFNVMDYGAVGNGVANDATAVNLAITKAIASPGGTVIFPPGVFNMGSTGIVIAGHNISLIGAGNGMAYDDLGAGGGSAPTPATILKWSGAPASGIGVDLFPDYVLNNPDPPLYNFTTIQGIGIDGNSVLTTGVRFTGTNLFRDMFIRGCSYGAYSPDWVNSTEFANVTFVDNTTHHLWVDGPVATRFAVHDSKFRACGTAGAAVLLNGCQRVTFSDTLFESNKSLAVKVINAGNYPLENITFSRCWFENNGYLGGANGYSLVIDGISIDYHPHWITFSECVFSLSANYGNTVRGVDVIRAAWTTFERCTFRGGDTTRHIVIDSTVGRFTQIRDHNPYETTQTYKQLANQGLYTFVTGPDNLSADPTRARLATEWWVGGTTANPLTLRLCDAGTGESFNVSKSHTAGGGLIFESTSEITVAQLFDNGHLRLYNDSLNGIGPALAVFVNGATAAGALSINLDGNGGTLTGVLEDGITFTIAGEAGTPTHTVSGAVTAAGNALAAVAFTPAIAAGGVADNAAVTVSRPQIFDVSQTGVVSARVSFAAGGNAVTNAGFLVTGSSLEQTAQYGFAYTPTIPATATNSAAAFLSNPTLAAGFTQAQFAHMLIVDAIKGAGTLITTQYGVFIPDLAAGGTNYSIYTGTAPVRFGGAFGCNGNAPQTKAAVNIAAVDPATTQALVNQLRALLIANGQAV